MAEVSVATERPPGPSTWSGPTLVWAPDGAPTAEDRTSQTTALDHPNAELARRADGLTREPSTANSSNLKRQAARRRCFSPAVATGGPLNRRGIVPAQARLVVPPQYQQRESARSLLRGITPARGCRLAWGSWHGRLGFTEGWRPIPPHRHPRIACGGRGDGKRSDWARIRVTLASSATAHQRG